MGFDDHSDHHDVVTLAEPSCHATIDTHWLTVIASVTEAAKPTNRVPDQYEPSRLTTKTNDSRKSLGGIPGNLLRLIPQRSRTSRPLEEGLLMSVPEFQQRFPAVSEQIVDRGFGAKHLINQYGDRKGSKLGYGKRENTALIEEGPKFQVWRSCSKMQLRRPKCSFFDTSNRKLDTNRVPTKTISHGRGS